MDALFIVVAELLIIPLILWGLIALELTVGLAGSIYAVIMGRRSPTDMVRYAWRGIRRRLLWSLIFMSSALLLADLVFFEQIVQIAIGSADERDDLDVNFGHAEGSFILGRVELHDLELAGARGGDDPSTKFEVSVERLIIDIDTKRLLTAAFAVEELSLDGVRGSFDRLRPSATKREPEQDDKPAREFMVERLHFGDMQFEMRDHTGDAVQAVEVVITELDIGPVASDGVVFDLLYRTRGRGSIAGHAFTLTSGESDGAPQTTLEVEALPLDALAGPLDKIAGVRATGFADLTVVDRYRADTPEPSIDIAVDLRLRELELEPSPNASVSAKFMVKMAASKLDQLGGEFPLVFAISVLRSELAGARSFSESGVVERVSDAIAEALKEQLTK